MRPQMTLLVLRRYVRQLVAAICVAVLFAAIAPHLPAQAAASMKLEVAALSLSDDGSDVDGSGDADPASRHCGCLCHGKLVGLPLVLAEVAQLGSVLAPPRAVPTRVLPPGDPSRLMEPPRL